MGLDSLASKMRTMTVRSSADGRCVPVRVPGSLSLPAPSLTSHTSPGGDGVKWQQPAAGPHRGCYGNPSHMCSLGVGGAGGGCLQLLGGWRQRLCLLEQKGPAVPVPPGPSSAQFTGLGTEQLFSLGRWEDQDSVQLSASSPRGGGGVGGRKEEEEEEEQYPRLQTSLKEPR